MHDRACTHTETDTHEPHEARGEDGSIVRTVYGDVLCVRPSGPYDHAFDVHLCGFYPAVTRDRVRPDAAVPRRYPHLPEGRGCGECPEYWLALREFVCTLPGGALEEAAQDRERRALQ